MIKKLLFVVFGTASFISSAQMNSAGDGLTLTNTNWQSNCYANIAPGNGGIMSHGTNIESGNDYIPANLGPYEFVSKAETSGSPGAAWFAIPVVVGDKCKKLFSEDIGIDMSSNSKVTITAKADEAGAEIEFYLGSEGEWSPTTSTWWTGTAEIKVSHTFAEADVEETFTFDFSVANPTGWSDWSGKSKIQSMGFYSKTETATFNIYEIKFGADASDDNDNDGGDDTDDDGGDDTDDDGGSNGQACNDLSDHGHGTWYDNLDVQPNGIVKCTFERDSILNTRYGALDKGLLQESNDAKYCGMCVEAIAPEHNNVPVIIQIVDECPDCYDRLPDGSINTGVNTKFGDIDLSITAFKALLDEDYNALGIGDFDWEEVSCPWQTPIHLIIQGSHDWYAKVIVANHVNRIATVEISNDGGSSWESMERGVDNGFVKGGYGGETKTFKITDIYGSEIIMSDINMVTNGDAVVNGSENFPPCGLTTSTHELNRLDYVTAFPNPANSSITFVGIEDVVKMEIVSVNGQVVASKNFQTSTAQISLDISALSPGIYVAKMTGDTNTGVATFVKK